jgi:ubiquinol-cytochrome c reductase iron-sulfur subunit
MEKVTKEELKRRKILLIATTGLGAIGIVSMIYPFFASLAPSEAARAAGAPVRFDVSRLAPGALATVEWRGRPIWILHRSEAMLARLTQNVQTLADPDSSQPQQPPYAKNPYRSIRPEYLVLTGICTHLGCIPLYRPEAGAADIGGDWPGGFYCPCHGSRFDLAGRVFKNVPAPLNMEVPAHAYLDTGELLIGADSRSA